MAKLILPNKRVGEWFARPISLENLQQTLNDLENDGYRIHSISEVFDFANAISVLVTADRTIEKEQNA